MTGNDNTELPVALVQGLKTPISTSPADEIIACHGVIDRLGVPRDIHDSEGTRMTLAQRIETLDHYREQTEEDKENLEDRLDKILAGVAKTLIGDHPDKFEQAKANPTLRGWFIGQAMRYTAGVFDRKLVERAFAKHFEIAA